MASVSLCVHLENWLIVSSETKGPHEGVNGGKFYHTNSCSQYHCCCTVTNMLVKLGMMQVNIRAAVFLTNIRISGYVKCMKNQNMQEGFHPLLFSMLL